LRRGERFAVHLSTPHRRNWTRRCAPTTRHARAVATPTTPGARPPRGSRTAPGTRI